MPKTWGRAAVAMSAALMLVASPARAIAPGAELDDTFGVNGLVHGGAASFGGVDGWRQATQIDGNGRIYAAGTDISSSSANRFLAEAFDPSGAVASWGTGSGGTLVDFRTAWSPQPSTTSDSAYALALGSQNTLVVVGGSYNADTTNADLAIARFTPTGTLDSSFGTAGRKVLSLGSKQFDEAYAVAIKRGTTPATDKIYVAGVSEDGGGGGSAFIVIRLNGNGTLDSTFGTGGAFFFAGAVSSPWAFASNMAIDSSGRIVVGGWECVDQGDTCKFEVLRLLTNGTLDGSFSADGYVDDAPTNDVRMYGLTIQSDGKIVVAGFSAVGGANSIVLSRFDTNGSLDSAFGHPGISPHVGSGEDRAYGVVQQADGKLVVVGETYAGSGNSFLITRFNPNGSLDTTFDSTPDSDATDDGFITTGFDINTSDAARAVALDAQGRMVAVGATCGTGPGSHCDLALARYTDIGPPEPPHGAKIKNLPVFQTAMKTKLSWSAIAGASPLKDYDVRYRAAFVTASKLSGYAALFTATTGTTSTLTFNDTAATYCFDVRAHDTAALVSPWSPDECTAIPVDDRQLNTTGTWKHTSSSKALKGTLSGTTTAGAKIGLSGYFRHLAVLVVECSTCGGFDVYVNKSKVKHVSLSSSTSRIALVNVASYSTLSKRSVVLRSTSSKKAYVDGIGMSLV